MRVSTNDQLESSSIIKYLNSIAAKLNQATRIRPELIIE